MVAPVEVEHLPKSADSSWLSKSFRDSKARSLLQDPVARTAVRCGLLILTWYFLSTALGLFNKKVVGKNMGVFGKGAFPAPLLLTGVQFAFQNMLARAVFATGLVQRVGERMSWRDWSKLVLPNGAVTGLDIGFSNASLVHITMSFYTMCKSTTPIFLLAFAFMWGLETPSWSLAGVVAVIVSGLLLLVRGEAEFDGTGFMLVMSASCMSGLRFTLTQVLLHGNRGSSNSNGSSGGSGQEAVRGKGASDSHGPSAFGGPLEVLELLTPVMSVTTLLLSLASERLWHTLPNSPYFSSIEHCLITLLLVLAGAVLAFLMVWTEYQVIKETSALTFMIAGTVKEVVTVITAVLVFGDKFGVVNGVGLVIVIGGVLLFNWYKLQKLKQQVRQRIRSKDGSIDLGLDGSEDGVPAANGSSSGNSPKRLLAAADGSSSRGGSPSDGVAAGSGVQLLPRQHSSSKRGKSSLGPSPVEADELTPEELLKLEFEPLLPLNGVMIRR